ncbi:MAG: precorrin-6A synthase (deacetylating) [Pseudomonadota bacterium]
MIDLVLIGIGTGNPEHVTRAAEAEMRRAGLVLLPRKRGEKQDLLDVRLHILDQSGSDAERRTFEMPERDTALPYIERVERWHDEIAAKWLEATHGFDPASGPVALLVWGDPGLYDSTLRIAGRLDPPARLRAVPGITAMQALTAAHAIPFNTLGGSVFVTTGRRLRADGWPDGAETVVVMLDEGGAYDVLDPTAFDIWWGAYLGMPEQILDKGPLADAGPRIAETRKSARAAHGWIMDTYILRKSAH